MVRKTGTIHFGLTVLVLVAGTVTAIAACLGLYYNNRQVARQATVDATIAIASVTAYNSTAVLMFPDPDEAALILAALGADDDIQGAWLVTDDTVFAEFVKPGTSRPKGLSSTVSNLERWDEDGLLIAVPVIDDDVKFGTLYLKADRSRETALRAGALSLASYLIVGLLFASVLLIYALRRLVTSPLHHLASVAARVSNEGRYDLRAEAKGNGEIATLIGSFNHMLEQIEERDAQLETQNNKPEDDAAARTTEIMLVNDHLRREKERVEAATEAKSQFLATISHEIRTPLNAMIGMTDLALETDLDEQQFDFLSTARRSAGALLALVDDILDFSRLDAGNLELQPVPFDLRDSLGDTAKAFAARAAEKGVELAYFVEADVPDRLLADLPRVRQVLVNLVGNAVKFTETGEVVVHVALVQDEGRDATISLTVTDTGVGISAAAIKNIFDSFSQGDGSMTRKHGGTGLGLSICHRLAQLMGGGLTVRSEIGVGSAFTATIQVRVLPDPIEAPQSLRVRGRHALIVDSNKTSRGILAEVLGTWGMMVTPAEDVEAALDAIRRTASTAVPVGMVMVSADLAPELESRLHETTADSDVELPTILLTASGYSEPEEASSRATVAVSKPFKPSELFDAIVQTLNEVEPTSLKDEVVRERAPRKSRLRVLVAEDNPVNRKLISALLKKRGHEVTVANDGVEAFNAVRDLDPFDVVLMDVQMPNMSGLEATRAIRDTEVLTGTRVPIIAVTANAMQGDRELCLEAGMDEYVTKPIRKKILFTAIEDVLWG